MAFLKIANAVIVSPVTSWADWSKISPSTFKNRTANGIIAKYDPAEYLLTHCTIIASVDVEKDKEHYITPQTTRFVNNNWDAWERDLLLGCYKSFIGADNFIEHIQIAEQSKGKVIDAVAREVIFPGKTADEGDSTSIYVDILVATDRKHIDLVKEIEDEKKDKLSMGCIVAFTICSKCANKAEDAVELCHHIKYLKGNKFIDEGGVERIIAELCGHKDDPDSVKFIDASWVKSPAFAGAVRRNIVAPSFEINEKIKAAFEIQPLTGTEGLRLQKVAGANHYVLAQDPPEEAPTEEEAPVEEPLDEEAPPEEPPVDEIPEEVETPEELEKEVSFRDLTDSIKREIKEKAKEQAKTELLQELSEEFEAQAAPGKYIPEEAHTRDTLVKSMKSNGDKDLQRLVPPDASKPIKEFESFKYREELMDRLRPFTGGLDAKISAELSCIFGTKKVGQIRLAIRSLSQGNPWILLKKYGLNGRDGILLSAFINNKLAFHKYTKNIYKAALKAKDFTDRKVFAKYCEELFDRKPTSDEFRMIAKEIKRYYLLEQEIS